MTFPAYPAYKDSGMAWLGAIPEHWILYRSKNVFSERNIKALESDEQLTASQKYGVIPQKLFSELEDQKVMQVILGRDILKKAEVNDFVISMRSFQGGLEFSSYSGAVSSAYVPLCANREIDHKFFKFLFKSGPFIAALQNTSNLVRDGQALRYNNFVQLSLPFPSINEQKAIGSFLDHETARIDALIEEQQRLIELLKEKRQAVISHAVTKGLDPTVPMKDSGVEWLGEVPAHWQVTKFGFLKTVLTDYTANGSFADLKANVTYLDSPGFARLVRLTDLRKNLENSDGVWIDEVAYSYLAKSALFGGEFLLANVGAYAGLFYQMPYGAGPASLAPNMFMAKFDEKKVLPSFVSLVATGKSAHDQLRLLATASSAQPKLNKDDFKSVVVALPPLQEQAQIAEFLDIQLASFDALMSEAEGGVSLLQERRSALISAAVTGKIDVRGWQPPASTQAPESAVAEAH